jgi:hypothetical protein
VKAHKMGETLSDNVMDLTEKEPKDLNKHFCKTDK